MTHRTAKERLDEIEETQRSLRESIEESKRLADRSQALLNRHKGQVERRHDA